MECTKDELTYLYQIMDIEEIVGFDLKYSSNQEGTKEIQKELERKGILVDNKITEYGLTILDVLSIYKKASLFYKFGEHTIFAQYQNYEYVMYSQEGEQFTIELLSQEELVAIILMKFKNWKDIKEGEYRKRFLSKEKFREWMEENEEVEALFYYKVDIENTKEEKGVFFLSDGYLQHYKGMTGELDMYPKEQVQKGIESIFNKEVNQWH